MISFSKTIGFRLTLLNLLLLTLPLVIDAVIVIANRYESRITESKDYLSEAAIMRTLPLSSDEPIPAITFGVFIKYLDLKNNFPKKPDSLMNERLKSLVKLEGLVDLTLVSINEGHYIVTASSREALIGQDVTEYFNNPNPFDVKKKYADPVTDYFTYQKSLELLAISAVAVESDEGKPIGIIAATIPGRDPFMKRLLKEENIYYPVRFAVVGPSGIVMIATDPALLFQYLRPQSEPEKALFFTHEKDLPADSLPEEPLQVVGKMDQDKFMRFIWNGEEQYAILEPMPWWEYSLLAYASKRDIYAKPLKDFLGVFLSYSVILILGGALTFIVAKRLMQPIQNLAKVMLSVKGGDLSARYEPHRFGYRINTLGQIFNQMLENLLANQQRAEKERIQRDIFTQELELGKQAQLRLLTERPQDFGNLEVVQRYIPANEVGGDFYDAFCKPNGKLILAVADASGKGVLACCYSLAARHILRTLATYFDNVAEVLFRGNNLFCADTGDSGMFVTVEIAQYDYETNILSYHSLGHNPGIICRRNGGIERLANGDMAMGVVTTTKMNKPHEKKLEIGDIVVLFTDGVSEMHNPESKLFGEERLIETIKENRDLSAHEIAERIEWATKQFANGREQFDDYTLIVVRVNANA